MKLLSKFVLVTVLGLLVAGPALAEGDAPAKAKPEKPKAAQGSDEKPARPPATVGVVESASSNQIVIKTRKTKEKESESLTIKVDDKTKIRIDGQAALATDLKAGMMITVPAYEGVAKSVNARTPKPKDETNAAEKPKKPKAE